MLGLIIRVFSALYLPRLKQVKPPPSLPCLPGQVNAASVVLLLLHWPLPAGGVVGKIRAEPVVKRPSANRPSSLCCDTCGVESHGLIAILLVVCVSESSYQ